MEIQFQYEKKPQNLFLIHGKIKNLDSHRIYLHLWFDGRFQVTKILLTQKTGKN
jgi:hypothetical protein